MLALNDWEDRFREDIEKIDASKRHMAGALLPAIPNHEDWNEFLGLMKTFFERTVGEFPCCLIILYGGLAFYEYAGHSFWPQFQKSLETTLTSAKQGEINQAFARAANQYGLKVRQRPGSTEYVGSAVHQIGVPLSLWDGFLEICEWALVHDNWAELSEEEWDEVATRRSGSRIRLKNFLLDNRETASDLIQKCTLPVKD